MDFATRHRVAGDRPAGRAWCVRANRKPRAPDHARPQVPNAPGGTAPSDCCGDRPRDLRALRWRCGATRRSSATASRRDEVGLHRQANGRPEHQAARDGSAPCPDGQSLPRSPPDPGQTCGPKCGWLAPGVSTGSRSHTTSGPGRVDSVRLAPHGTPQGIQPAPARPDRGSCHEFALGSRDARLQPRPPSPEPAPGQLRDRFGRPHQWWASRRCGRHRRFG